MEPIINSYAPILCILFCAIAGSILFQRTPGSFRLLTIHAWISVVTDVLGIIATQRHYDNNQVIFNFYLPVDLLLMLFAVRSHFGRHFGILAAAVIVCFALVFGISLATAGLFRLATPTIVANAITLTITYFLFLMRNAQGENRRFTRGIYCIAISVMLYYCCIIPYFGFMHYIHERDPQLAGKLFNINNAFSSLRYIFTGIGLILISKPAKSVLPVYE